MPLPFVTYACKRQKVMSGWRCDASGRRMELIVSTTWFVTATMTSRPSSAFVPACGHSLESTATPGFLNSGGCVQFLTIHGKNLTCAGLSPLHLKIQTVVVHKCLSICATTPQRTTKNHLFQSPKLLKEWMSSIRSTQGTARLPAVEFELGNRTLSLRGAIRT